MRVGGVQGSTQTIPIPFAKSLDHARYAATGRCQRVLEDNKADIANR